MSPSEADHANIAAEIFVNADMTDFVEAAQDVVDFASDEGCTDDVTVTKKSPVERMREILSDAKQEMENHA